MGLVMNLVANTSVFWNIMSNNKGHASFFQAIDIYLNGKTVSVYTIWIIWQIIISRASLRSLEKNYLPYYSNRKR